MVADLDLIPLDRAVQDVACDVGDPPLRTLDALLWRRPYSSATH